MSVESGRFTIAVLSYGRGCFRPVGDWLSEYTVELSPMQFSIFAGSILGPESDLGGDTMLLEAYKLQ